MEFDKTSSQFDRQAILISPLTIEKTGEEEYICKVVSYFQIIVEVSQF